METVLESQNQTVVIGPELPFKLIGERINPTGRQRLRAEMVAGNFDRVAADALAQVAAGAHLLDVNAGVPLEDEPGMLASAVRAVQDVVDVPLTIDSSIVAALEAGLAAYRGKALVNSVTGEEGRLESVLPLVKRHNAAVIGIANDELGISEDPEVRFAIARKIVERAEDHGIHRHDVVIDPLVMPVGAVPLAGVTVLALVRRIQTELGVNTICGASNVSFGLPKRSTLNASFLTMLISSGMSCAIANPLDFEIRQAVLSAEVLLGRDEFCMTWIADFNRSRVDEA
jgi:5-methyltetrahydrofolate--homocysteine methyltransferase